MSKEFKIYICKHCGNIVTSLKESGAPITCCGEAMTKLEPNTTDGAVEKHVPVIQKENGKVKVSVGAVPHPMLPEHYIEWIAASSDEKLVFKFLKPGDEPSVGFCNLDSSTVYAYCNLHGLWKA